MFNQFLSHNFVDETTLAHVQASIDKNYLDDDGFVQNASDYVSRHLKQTDNAEDFVKTHRYKILAQFAPDIMDTRVIDFLSDVLMDMTKEQLQVL